LLDEVEILGADNDVDVVLIVGVESLGESLIIQHELLHGASLSTLAGHTGTGILVRHSKSRVVGRKGEVEGVWASASSSEVENGSRRHGGGGGNLVSISLPDTHRSVLWYVSEQIHFWEL
jgi:hypothetical protein